MVQGSGVSTSHRGMRRGISLVEMMIAIVLFGAVSIVGFKYSKNFYDTSLSAKKARVAALVEQAIQLSNAYDVYSMQFGAVPTSEQNLTQANVKILTSIPDTITEIGTTGWVLDSAIDADEDSADDDTAFVFAITTLATNDDEEYCAILNNMMKSTEDLNTTTFLDATYNYNTMGTAYCQDTDAGGIKNMVFVKKIVN